MKLSEYSTKELSEELARREGVKRIVAGPYEDVRIEVNGPAIVLINED